MSTFTHGRWTVCIIKAGEMYGASNSLVNDTNSPFIEFYDNNHDKQFVQRYLLETLLQRKSRAGLMLQGGVPEWTVSADELDIILDWAKVEVGLVAAAPIATPANETIKVIQDVLVKHAKSTLQADPIGYFAFQGALEHTTSGSRLLTTIGEDTSESAIQLKILAEYEW